MGKLPSWTITIRVIDSILISGFTGFGMFWLWKIMFPNLNIFFCIFYGCLVSGATGGYLKLISQ